MAFVFNEMFACFDKGCCPNGKTVSMLGSKVARPAGFAAFEGEGTTYKRPEYQRTDLDGELQQVRTELFGNDPRLPLDGRRTDAKFEAEVVVPMSSIRKLNEVDENFDPNRPAPNPKGKLKSRFFDGKSLLGGSGGDRHNSFDVPVQHPRVLAHTLQQNKSVSPTGDPLNPGVARPRHPPPPSDANTRVVFSSLTVQDAPPPSDVNTRVVFSSLTVQEASFNASSRAGSLAGGQEHGRASSSFALSSDSWDSSFNRDGLVGPARHSLDSESGSGSGPRRRESSMGGQSAGRGERESMGSSILNASARQSDASSASVGGGGGGMEKNAGPAVLRKVAAIEEPRVGVGIVCFDRLDGSIAVDYVTQCSSVYGQVQSGDVIHSVNGRDVKGLAVAAVQSLLFGPPFTHVLLGVSRPRTGPELPSGRRDMHVNILCVRR